MQRLEAIITTFMSFYKSSHAHGQLGTSRQSKKKNRRRSDFMDPLLIILVFSLFTYLTVTAYIWFNISTNFESTTRSLRRKVQFVHYINKTTDRRSVSLNSVSVTFQQSIFSSYRQIVYPPVLLQHEFDWHPDYNNLNFDSLEKDDFMRKIMYTNEEDYVDEAEDTDDYFSASIPVGDGDDPNDCQPVTWTALLFPVCNTFHEISIDVKNNKYLGYGFAKRMIKCSTRVHNSHLRCAFTPISSTLQPWILPRRLASWESTVKKRCN
jgi:hypothetical protein